MLRRTRTRLYTQAVTSAVDVIKATAASAPVGVNIDLARMMAQASQNIGDQFNVIPADVQEAMTQQGLDVKQPFGPGSPLTPYRGLDDQPRAFNYNVGRNIATQPRQDRVSFDTLDALIKNYDIAMICKRHVINDVRTLPLMFTAADGVTDNVDEDIAVAKAFFRRPDGQSTFRAWLAKYLEDIISYDAGALYKRRDRVGRLIGLDVVSGRTILPLIDYYGRTPVGDAPAYGQNVQGTPWLWLRNDELIYEPLNPTSDSVYGTPPIEMVLLRANTDLRFQWWLLQRFTDGNTPAGFMEVPPDMQSPAQITEMQETWDAFMQGAQAKKNQVRFVPNGSKFTRYIDQGFDKEMALYLFRLCAAAFGVTPNDLGITDDVNRSSSETQVDVQFRVGTKPITSHLEDQLDAILQEDLGLRVQARFDDAQEDDRLGVAQEWDIWIKNGAASVDEARTQVLGLPVESGEITPRFVFSARAGAIPLAAITAIAGPIDPLTGAPMAGSVQQVALPAGQFAAAAGVVAQPDDVNAVQAANAAKLAPAGPSDAASLEAGATGAGDTNMAKALARATTPTAAGLVVIAADTGRLLMLQRALDDTDPASGAWEFPGGCLEPGEQPIAAAWREWAEEVGQIVPPGIAAGGWVSGVYEAFVWLIDSETLVATNADNKIVANPDDPDGDTAETAETVAWMALDHLADFAGLRTEVAESTDWDLLDNVVGGLVAKEATAGLTTDTGIVGIDLAGQAEQDLPDDVKALLSKWRANARSQVAKGKAPRRFDDAPPIIAETVWPLLEHATDRESVDAAFELVKARLPKALAGGLSRTP